MGIEPTTPCLQSSRGVVRGVVGRPNERRVMPATAALFPQVSRCSTVRRVTEHAGQSGHVVAHLAPPTAWEHGYVRGYVAHPGHLGNARTSSQEKYCRRPERRHRPSGHSPKPATGARSGTRIGGGGERAERRVRRYGLDATIPTHGDGAAPGRPPGLFVPVPNRAPVVASSMA